MHLQAFINQFAARGCVNLCAYVCLSVCFSCACLHTSVCLSAAVFRLAVPTVVLTAADEGGVHLHSESQWLSPLLLHCCDSALRAPAHTHTHTAAVPVMFGYSCAGEPVADIQSTAKDSGLGLYAGPGLVGVTLLCEPPRKVTATCGRRLSTSIHTP